MIDLTSGDWTALLRTPDLRLVGVEFGRLRFDRPFRLAKPDPSRANFYLVRKGGAWFRAQGGKAIFLPTGSVVGVEGRSHEWLDSSQLHPAERGARHGNADFAGALPVEIFTGSIDRSVAVLQRLPWGSIVIPARAEPYASLIAKAVEMLECLDEGSSSERGVARRLAEIIMLQIVGYARERLLKANLAFGSIQHDEYLLRAMTTFLATPGKRWTVADLAASAGLSRAAFAQRFRCSFGEPPMATINRFRLLQASEILADSSASISVIAEQIGFGSSAALVRAFKRQFGQTPGCWRRSCRLENAPPQTR